MCTNMWKRALQMGHRHKRLPIRLGRWSRSEKKNITDRKIELSNIDHCGTCPLPPKKKKNDFDNINISLCALQSLHAYPIKS